MFQSRIFSSHVLVGAAVTFRNEAQAPVAIGLERRLGQRFHLDEPLQREQRLDHVARTLAHRDRMTIGFFFHERAAEAQVVDDTLARLVAVESGVGTDANLGIGDLRIGIQDRRHRQIVT